MRLQGVILTLGLTGVWGPMLIDGEKIVFVVPRYIRRSTYTSNASPFHISQDNEHGFKIRPSTRGYTKRPYFSGHYRGNPVKNEQFFNAEKHRIPQGGSDDFGQSIFAGNLQHQNAAVNHVVIPHGKGIAHGISFGKGYIPYDESKNGNNENYNEFPTENVNNLEYLDTHNHNQGDVKFEDDDFPGFQNQEQDSGQKMMNWNFGGHESGAYAPTSYGQEANSEESNLELENGYKSQETSSAPKEEFFYPAKVSTRVEEPRGAISEENITPSRISSVLPTPAPLIMMQRKLEPIILRDTIDMKEYVEKVEAFAKNWPSAAALQGFNWKNQILNPPSSSGSNIQNYNQGFNSYWPNNLARNPMSSGYEVQEDSVEEPTQKKFRIIM